MSNKIFVSSIVAFAALAAGSGFAFSRQPAQTTQEYFTLDRRLSQVEQKLYTMDTMINQLQRQIMASSRTQPNTSATTQAIENEQLSLQVQQLRSRIGEIECAVVKLDQRTLPRSEKTTEPKDACRRDANTPVRLSQRQN